MIINGYSALLYEEELLTVVGSVDSGIVWYYALAEDKDTLKKLTWNHHTSKFELVDTGGGKHTIGLVIDTHGWDFDSLGDSPFEFKFSDELEEEWNER